MAPRVRTLVLACLVFACSAAAADGATFTVTTGNDGQDAVAADGICATSHSVCTLRAAVQEANALAGPDTIVLPAGVYGLGIGGGNEDAAATGDLDIISPITIVGAGAAVTEVQQTADRVFDVRPTGSLTISDLKISNGFLSDAGPLFDGPGDGAGIRSSGVLVASRMWLADNFANIAALRNGGGLGVEAGTATVTDSLFTGNGVVIGVGQAASVRGGTLTLQNVTAADHTGSSSGGVFGVSGGHLVIRGATSLGNAASAIDREVGGTADVSLLLTGGPLVPCTSDSNDAVHFGAGNVFDQVTTDCSGVGDTTPRFYAPGGAKMSGLQSAGGTLPQVFVPLNGSPAIDTGAPCGTLTTDARGGARPQGASCDAGAVEVGSLSDVQVTGVGPATAESTDAVTDTFVVANGGTDSARTVAVTVAISGPGTLFGLATTKGTCSLAKRRCVIGDLSGAQQVLIRADLRAGGRGVLKATLAASHLTMERVTTNDRASISTTVKPDTSKPRMTLAAGTLHVGSRKSATFKLLCPGTERTCTGTVKPTFRGKHLRSVRVKLVGGRAVTIRVALDAAARKAIRRGSKLKVALAVNVADASGNRFRGTVRGTIRK